MSYSIFIKSEHCATNIFHMNKNNVYTLIWQMHDTIGPWLTSSHLAWSLAGVIFEQIFFMTRWIAQLTPSEKRWDKRKKHFVTLKLWRFWGKCWKNQTNKTNLLIFWYIGNINVPKMNTYIRLLAPGRHNLLRTDI